MTTPIFQQLQEIRAYTTGVLRARHEYNKHPFADGHRHPGPNDPDQLSAAPDTITTTQPPPEPETQP